MTSAASFSAWIYPTGPGSMATYGGIIVNKEGEYEIARFADGTIQWAIANSNPGWAWINTGYVVPLNQWTHVALTYDNGVVKTYINGALTHTYNGAGSIGDVDGSMNDFRIGGRQVVSQNFQGRIDEVRVYNRALTASEVSSLPSGALGSPSINWLVADQLGTPRMIFDKTGSLTNTKRHDYLPFGEELFAGIGGRTTALGYTSDTIREQFTSKERDVETNLDYFNARYYTSTQGRFTSPDEPRLGQNASDPQTWNLYSYTSNSPLNRVDEDGRRWFYKCGNLGCDVQWVDPNKDGSYTSPGAGYKEFIPKSSTDYLIFYDKEGYTAYYFGERKDGSPNAFWLHTGKVENKPEHIMMFVGIFQDFLQLARVSLQSFVAWRAAREAETTIADILANATKGKVSKSIQYHKTGGINQANKDFDALVGRGGNVTNRGGGLRTATLKDGTKINVRPFSSGGKSTLEVQPPTGKVIKIRYD